MRIRFIPLIFIYYLRSRVYICIQNIYIFTLFLFFFFFSASRLFVLLYYYNICFHLPSLPRREGRVCGGGAAAALNEKNFFACFCQASRGIAFCNLWLNVLPSKNPLSKLDLFPCRYLLFIFPIRLPKPLKLPLRPLLLLPLLLWYFYHHYRHVVVAYTDSCKNVIKNKSFKLCAPYRGKNL